MVLGVAFQVSSTSQGTIFLDASRMKNLTQIVPHAICLTGPSSPNRRDVERLIERTFSNCYDSRISRHYPNLLSVHDAMGNVLAAVGFRCAADEPLFLEQYLNQGVDRAASAAFGTGIDRHRIIEIGNLASNGKGASIFLFVTLAAYLQQQGYTHAVATATDTLRKAFRFLKFDLVELAAADRNALPDQGSTWGRYYERDPVVVACPISQGFGRLERFLPTRNNPDIRALFSSQGHHHVQETTIQ
jgi:hypothetical protein